jgi:hypothetical protein
MKITFFNEINLDIIFDRIVKKYNIKTEDYSKIEIGLDYSDVYYAGESPNFIIEFPDEIIQNYVD